MRLKRKIMNNNVKIIDTNEGVDININGNAKFSDIEILTQNCSTGKCDCSPAMLEKIDNIQTNGKDGAIKITLHSDNLDASEVQNCMNECDCGF
jgi:hypothetical protein